MIGEIPFVGLFKEKDDFWKSSWSNGIDKNCFTENGKGKPAAKLYAPTSAVGNFMQRLVNTKMTTVATQPPISKKDEPDTGDVAILEDEPLRHLVNMI